MGKRSPSRTTIGPKVYPYGRVLEICAFVLKAHRLLYHPTLGLGVIKKKKTPTPKHSHYTSEGDELENRTCWISGGRPYAFLLRHINVYIYSVSCQLQKITFTNWMPQVVWFAGAGVPHVVVQHPRDPQGLLRPLLRTGCNPYQSLYISIHIYICIYMYICVNMWFYLQKIYIHVDR